MPTPLEKTLIESAEKGDIHEVEHCLNDPPVNINAKGEKGMAAIHQAAIKGHIEIIRLLIARKAKINIKDADGNTPLHCAIHGSHKDIVRFLLEEGADYRLKNDYKETLNINTIEHRTTNPYDYLSHENFFYIQKGKETLRKKPCEVNFNLTTNEYKEHGNAQIVVKEGVTPLELAQKEEKPEMAELISDFISQQKYSSTQTASKISNIETSINKISQVEKKFKS